MLIEILNFHCFNDNKKQKSQSCLGIEGQLQQTRYKLNMKEKNMNEPKTKSEMMI